MDFLKYLYNDGFNRVQTERPHRSPPRIHQKLPPPDKILLYFFIVVPGRRWHVLYKDFYFILSRDNFVLWH